MEPVTLQTNLLDLVEQYPELKKVFGKHGISWLDITCLDKTDNMTQDAARRADVGQNACLQERMSSLRKCVTIWTASLEQIKATASVARECVAICRAGADRGPRDPIKNEHLRKNA